jgi:plasmid maintenance system antidote protein VapI
MEATGTTQAQLAKRLGVGQPHISNVLRHTRKASFALALRLSRMTNVPIEAIAGDDLMSEISVR